MSKINGDAANRSTRDGINYEEAEKIIGYEFKNKTLLIQAFMRRSYGLECKAYADNEVLEFVGDRAIDYVLIRCMMDQYSEFYGTNDFDDLFQCSMHEGSLNRQMIRYKEGDYLASRFFDLGLSKYILSGKGDEVTFAAAGDVMEAIIAAIAIDCDWDYMILSEAVERLLDVQLEESEIDEDAFTMLNNWHRRHFGEAPVYDVEQTEDKRFVASVTIQVPDSDIMYKITGDPELTRSRARSGAAQDAYEYLVEQGIWKNLKESLTEPILENAINQLQQLYQKGYIAEPEYEIVRDGREWEAICKVGSRITSQNSRTKIFAKKRAAYSQLLQIMEEADLCDDKWRICLIGPLADELLLFYKRNPEVPEDAEDVEEAEKKYLEAKYEFVLKSMNTYDTFLARQANDEYKIGEYHLALQSELCRQMGIQEDAFVVWKRKPLSRMPDNCSE